MRAAFVDALGSTDAIRYGELPDPVPGPGEVLVRVAAVAVNVVDTLVRSGAFETAVPLPLVLGRDLVGQEAGTGRWVWCNSLGHAGRQGAAAELAAVPADRLYPLPDGVHPVEAAAMLHPAATAHLALVTHARVHPAESVFVAGGNGAVGSCLIRLARRLDATVSASARGAAARAYVTDLGATEVVEELIPPRPVDVHVDATGRCDLGASVNAVALRGRVIVIAGGGRSAILDTTFYTRDVSVLGFVISRATVAELADAAVTVNALLADGDRLPVEVLPLSAAADAHRRVESGETGRVAGAHRRLVLTP